MASHSSQRRWTLGLAALVFLAAGGMVVVCRVVNLRGARAAGHAWLNASLDQRLPVLHRVHYDRLAHRARYFAIHAPKPATGELFGEVDATGRVRASSDPACWSGLADLLPALRTGTTRSVILCGRTAALVAALWRPESSSWIIAGEPLQQAHVDELGKLFGTEVVLRDGEGALLSTVRDDRGWPRSLELPEALDLQSGFGPRRLGEWGLDIGGYAGFGPGQLGRGQSHLDFYTLIAPFPDAPPRTQLRVLLLLPVEALTGTAFTATLLQSIGALLLALISFTGLARLQHRLTRPLLALQQANLRVAEGDLSVQVPTFGGGESARVAASFNAMVARLRETNSRMLSVEKLAAVGTLAAGVAHEINNPLSFVVANLEYLEAELPALLTEDQRSKLQPALADAMEGASRVRAIVRDMRLFSGKTDEARTRVDVRPILESSLHMAGNQIRHCARLVLDFREVPQVQASPQRLGQVFLNLLVNAAQAIKRGNSADDVIQVRTRLERGFVVVEVTDTGEGIPAENLPRLFDPFFTTKPVGEGTGLGLSICHGIVAALGGKFEVESKLGSGSAFRVLLPPAPAAAEAQVTPAETPVLVQALLGRAGQSAA